MKKIFNKKTYGYIGLFLILCYFFYTQKSYLIDELLMVEENIKVAETDIKIAEKRITVIETKIADIKAKNALNIKEKVNIDEVKKKIKKQLKAYNLINETVKINLNTLTEQEKYLDAFVAEFELVNSGASATEIAKTLDFLGIYGVVESYKGNKVIVYVDIGTPPANPVKKEIEKELKIEGKIMKADTIIKTSHDYLQNKFSTIYLNASANKYSINLLSSPSYSEILKILEKTKMIESSFVFSFGSDKKLYKVMYGVYLDKQSANEIIAKLPQELQKYNPRVEKVSIKQNLFHKYHTQNNQTTKGTTL